MSSERFREVRRAAEVRVLRAGMSAHAVGEIIEVDYGAARARVTRSITRPPTHREADVFRERLASPGSVIESFEYEYLDERPTDSSPAHPTHPATGEPSDPGPSR